MGQPRTFTVRAEPLARSSWGPFGWLPVDDTDPSDGQQTLEFEWRDPHVNFIAHAADEVQRDADRIRCDRMYRHDTHTQTLMPTNCDSVVAVAPAKVDFSRPEHLDTIRAFVLHPLDCVVLARGTWHWGPFPLDGDHVRLFNVQGRRYSEDNACVDLTPATGATVEIETTT